MCCTKWSSVMNLDLFWGRIFSCVWPIYERAVSNLDRSMHRSLWVYVAHSLFIEGSHTTENTVYEKRIKTMRGWSIRLKNWIKNIKGADHFKWRNSWILWCQERFVLKNENIMCDRSSFTAVKSFKASAQMHQFWSSEKWWRCPHMEALTCQINYHNWPWLDEHSQWFISIVQILF